VRADQEELEEVPTTGGTESVDLRDAFARLPPADRTVLYLLAVEGRHPDEIAEGLGINSGAVRMRISRARQRLKLAYGTRP
jgi:RNA polymerase sigma-70 factor (ECF subfamily)